MKKLTILFVLASAIVAGGCVSLKARALSFEAIQGLLSTLPHSFTGSKHIEETTGFNVAFAIDFKGLKWDENSKAWTWTAASYVGHSPWTNTSIVDAPEIK